MCLLVVRLAHVSFEQVIVNRLGMNAPPPTITDFYSLDLSGTQKITHSPFGYPQSSGSFISSKPYFLYFWHIFWHIITP